MIKKILAFKNELAVENHQLLSFSPFFARRRSCNKNENQLKTVFFPGCSLMSLGEDAVFELYEILLKKHPDMGLSGFCCAKPSKYIRGGKNYPKRAERIKKHHEDTLIYTACPNCYRTLGDEGAMVASIWPVIDEFFPEKRLGIFDKEQMMIHDPCTARNNDKDHQSIRSIMRKLGIEVVEFENNRKKTICCGKINMTMALDRDKGMKMLQKRASECKREKVASYCASCVHSFGMAGKKGIYISELMMGKKNRPSWGNRIKFVRNLKL